MHYCALKTLSWLSFIIQILIVILLFLLLGTTADDFFVPALCDISDTLRLEQDVAGVTFLALGNGAPDVFSMIAGANNNAFDMSLGAAFGSGLFIVSVVLACVGLAASPTLDTFGFFRDASVYLGCAVYLFFMTLDKKVLLGEAIALPLVYCLFVVFVVVSGYIRRRRRRKVKRIACSIQGDLAVPLVEAEEIPPPTKVQDAEVEGVSAVGPGPLDEASAQQQPNKAEPEAADDDQERKGNLVIRWVRGVGASTGWKDMGFVGRIIYIILLPFTVVRVCTIPSSKGRDYVRLLLNCLCSPLFCYLAIKKQFGPYCWICVLGGVAISPLVLLLNKKVIRAKIHLVFSIWAFGVSVLWLNTLANELVALLRSIGTVIGIGNAILGCTVLAWGNSVGDLISNLCVAKDGRPGAAVSACYAAPLLNALLGLGASTIIQVVKRWPRPFTFSLHTNIIIAFCFLATALVSSLIIIPLCKMRIRRWHAVALIVFYGGFTVCAILNEVGVFGHPHW